MSPKVWKCPKCGRRFAHKNQWHSCQVVPLSAHLKKAGPKVQAIYRAVIGAIGKFGPLQVVPTKSGINLLSRTSLGGIRLMRDQARLGIVMLEEVRSPRIRSTLRISPRSVVHYIDLTSTADVDAELKGWLRESYRVGMLAGTRPP